MTRELKLALIVGFSLVLVVMVLVSDHLSKARKTDLAPPANETALAPKLNVQPEVLAPTNPNLLNDPLASNGASGRSIEDQKIDLKMAAERAALATRDGNQGGMISLTPTLSATDAPAPISNNAIPSPIGSGGVTPLGSEPPAPLNTYTILPEPQVMPVPTTAVPSANEKVHVVGEGQSLYAISKQYYGNGKYWKQLLDYNKSSIKSENALKVGMKVRIPELATLTGKPADVKSPVEPLVKAHDSAVAKADPARGGKGRTYVVQKGDTPGAIAKKQLGSSKRARELMEKNKLQDEGGLKIGMVLQLPE